MPEPEKPCVLPAVLGWSNTGPDSLQLYALDAGPSPRWMDPPHGRRLETALREQGAVMDSSPYVEGDRFLLVHVGRAQDVTEDRLQSLRRTVEQALEDHRG